METQGNYILIFQMFMRAIFGLFNLKKRKRKKKEVRKGKEKPY